MLSNLQTEIDKMLAVVRREYEQQKVQTDKEQTVAADKAPKEGGQGNSKQPAEAYSLWMSTA